MTIVFSGTITNLGPLPAGPGGELAIFNNDGSVVSNFQFLLPFNFIVGPGETTAVIPFFSFTVVANPTLGPFVIRYSIRESNALVFTANIQDVPEPSTMLLLGAGLAGLILRKETYFQALQALNSCLVKTLTRWSKRRNTTSVLRRDRLYG